MNKPSVTTISDELKLLHFNNANSKMSILYVNPDVDRECPLVEVQLFVQIFHTDAKHFDLRKAYVVDPDERRPIYAFTFDDQHKAEAFIQKRGQYFLAWQMAIVVANNGTIEPAAVCINANDLYRLRSFVAWLEHIKFGQPYSGYVKDCVVNKIKGSSMLHIPTITFEEFVAALKGEKELVPKNVDLTEQINIDGQLVDVDNFTEYMKNKTQLERTECEVAH